MLFAGRVHTSAKELQAALRGKGLDATASDAALAALVLEEAAYRATLQGTHGALAYAKGLGELRGQRHHTVDSDALQRSMRSGGAQRAGGGTSEAVQKAKAALYARRAQREAERMNRSQVDLVSEGSAEEAREAPAKGKCRVHECHRASSPPSSPGPYRTRRRSSPARVGRSMKCHRSSSDEDGDLDPPPSPPRRPPERSTRPAQPGPEESQRLLFDDSGFVVIDPLGEHSHVRNGDARSALDLNYDPLANAADRWLHELYDSEDERRKEAERRGRARRPYRSPRWLRMTPDESRQRAWDDLKAEREREREAMRQAAADLQLARARAEEDRAKDKKRRKLAIEADRALLSFETPD
jgi:hypothetical protein